MKFLLVREVAKTLRISRNTAYKLVQRGQIRAVKIGALWRVPEEAVRDLSVQNSQRPPGKKHQEQKLSNQKRE